MCTFLSESARCCLWPLDQFPGLKPQLAQKRINVFTFSISAYVKPKVQDQPRQNGHGRQSGQTGVRTLPKSHIDEVDHSLSPGRSINSEEDLYTDYRTIVRMQRSPTRKVDIIQVEETREEDTEEDEGEIHVIQDRTSAFGAKLILNEGQSTVSSEHREVYSQGRGRRPIKGVPGLYASLEPMRSSNPPQGSPSALSSRSERSSLHHHQESASAGSSRPNTAPKETIGGISNGNSEMLNGNRGKGSNEIVREVEVETDSNTLRFVGSIFVHVSLK